MTLRELIELSFGTLESVLFWFVDGWGKVQSLAFLDMTIAQAVFTIFVVWNVWGLLVNIIREVTHWFDGIRKAIQKKKDD